MFSLEEIPQEIFAIIASHLNFTSQSQLSITAKTIYSKNMTFWGTNKLAQLQDHFGKDQLFTALARNIYNDISVLEDYLFCVDTFYQYELSIVVLLNFSATFLAKKENYFETRNILNEALTCNKGNFGTDITIIPIPEDKKQEIISACLDQDKKAIFCSRVRTILNDLIFKKDYLNSADLSLQNLLLLHSRKLGTNAYKDLAKDLVGSLLLKWQTSQNPDLKPAMDKLLATNEFLFLYHHIASLYPEINFDNKNLPFAPEQAFKDQIIIEFERLRLLQQVIDALFLLNCASLLQILVTKQPYLLHQEFTTNNSLLHQAIIHTRPNLLRLLIKSGADIHNAKGTFINAELPLYIKHHIGMPPLLYAVITLEDAAFHSDRTIKMSQIVNILLKHGADAHQKGNYLNIINYHGQYNFLQISAKEKCNELFITKEFKDDEATINLFNAIQQAPDNCQEEEKSMNFFNL